MKFNKKTIIIAIVALLIENAILIGAIKGNSTISGSKHSLIVSGNKQSETVAIDIKSIVVNQNQTAVKVLALKAITKDTNIDKKTQTQIDNNVKASGGEQKFEEGLKKINFTKDVYVEQLKYNILFNEALQNEKTTVSDDEVKAAISNNTVQSPDKELKIYSSSNKYSLENISKQLTDKKSTQVTKDVQQGVMEVGPNNKDLWDAILGAKDGDFNKIIASNGTNYLIYNIATITKSDKLKQASDAVLTQKKVTILNKEIDSALNNFSYKIK